MTHSAAVITISDGVARGTREDEGGDLAAHRLEEAGFTVARREVVPDEAPQIQTALRSCIEEGIALVTTTGGTGFGPRDVTPEATRALLERNAPGLAELMRAEGKKKTPLAALSRGVAGIAGGSLVVNLPGSPKAVAENLDALVPVLPHALQLIAGDTEHRR